MLGLRKLTCDRETRETVTRFDVEHVLNEMIGSEDDRVGDEAILEELDLADHARL